LLADRFGRQDRTGPAEPGSRRYAGYQGEHYTDRSLISEELKYARSLCERHGWPVIDVTRRSIEETAAAILALRPKWR
jgi:regulator of PEP synthase PpsR (kinase-PPPase family)